ncbi:hypothetical protein FisN_6Lh412 [Fistulifera solaris]|uniref:PDZ domain-containing protein n=1 Tax=Fistulifera solaris TaxID=1519565 RepID=A0A1Z5JLG6_FISSO|nr:hypothetical protein FisN_6Lh412 [Fistulifera solaris]|eukprot:GAX14628.1 hypothetical protein FisN_6Lh412 [Fistulifera solaris]
MVDDMSKTNAIVGPVSHDDKNNSQEDLKSINLLMLDERSITSTTSSCTWSDAQVVNALRKKKMSPATQTLYQLSQTVDQLDLLCNNSVIDSPAQRNVRCPPEFSQYEFSVAAILANAAQSKHENESYYENDEEETQLQQDENVSNQKKRKGDNSLLFDTSSVLVQAAKAPRRRETTTESNRKVDVQKKPSRVKHKVQKSQPSQRIVSKEKKQSAAQSSTLPKKNPQGSYRSQSVEKWRGKRLIKVFQSMRQAAEAEGTHHGHIKRLIESGVVTNGCVWKYQQQLSSISTAAESQKETKARKEISPKNTKQKAVSTAKSSARVRSSTKAHFPVPAIQPKRTPVKRPSPHQHPKSKSVQRLKNDGSVARTFPSMLQASLITDISRRTIRDCIKDRNERDTDGFGWRLMETGDELSPVNSANQEKTDRSPDDEEVPKDASSDQLPASKTSKATANKNGERGSPNQALGDDWNEKKASDRKEKAIRSVDDYQEENVHPKKQAPSASQAKAAVAKTSESVSPFSAMDKVSKKKKLLKRDEKANRSVEVEQEEEAPTKKQASSTRNAKVGEESIGDRVNSINAPDNELSEQSQDKPELPFDILFVDITSTGKIGLMIRSVFPNKQVRLSVEKSTSLKVHEYIKGCIVESVRDESHCGKVGIRAEDNLFLVEKIDGHRVLNGNYDKILRAARSEERPINLCIARPIVEKLTSKIQSDTAPIETSARSKSEVPQSKSDYDAPYCALCNGGEMKHQVHHAWCKLNPQFHKSGAHEVLRRVTEGMKLGCTVCGEEFRTGRIQKNSVHTSLCRENQKVIFGVEELPQHSEAQSNVKHKEKKLKSSHPAAAAVETRNTNEPTLKTKRGRSVKVSDKIRTSGAYLSDIGRDGSDTSEDLEPQRKRKPVSALFRAKRSPEAVQDTVRSTSGSIQSTKAAASNRRSAVDVPRSKPKPLSNDANAPCVSGTENKQNASFAADYTSASDAEYDESGKLAIIWEPCPDPWGQKGYVEGDIVVFSNKAGIGSVETALPSPRFEIDPLSGSCRYRKTHHTPNEGFHALLLQRDPQCTLSWGFSVQRHEFGGACLVSSVEPMSPAHAAVFVGAHHEEPSIAALRKNDMILTIDGKEVGGMTVESFHLALELAGSELILVVSRYKGLLDNPKTQERRLLSNLDKHINDPNRLHWADIGASDSSAFQEYRKPKETELIHLSSPLSNAQVQPKLTPPDSNSIKSAVHPTGNRIRMPILSNMAKERKDPPITKTNVKDSCSLPSINKVENIADHEEESTRRSDQESESDSEISSVEPTDLRSVLDEDSSNNDEFREDGNAWCGCVCGKEHPARGNYFWIQCEACCSCFNVYQKCVGFGKKEAENIERWACWACGESMSLERSDKLSAGPQKPQPLKPKRKQPISEKAARDVDIESIESSDDEIVPQQIHNVGSLVFIREHAWSGVNNPEGIARVTGVRMDEEDGRVYDVKYIVGRSSKGVFARYITPHTFD